MMSQWAKNFTRMGKDGYHLARAVVEHRSRNVRPLLLDHARQSNSVATGILHVDKEVGLVRYYGVSGYLKQRFQSTSALTTSEDSSSTSGDGTTTTTATAKVAFMVTTSMKQELADRLGYNEDQIKAMTPVQASLILNESIAPNEMATRLPQAEAAYEEQRQKEEENARQKAEQQQQQRHQEAAVSADADDQPAASSAALGSHSSQFFSDGGYRSRDELAEVQNSTIGAFFSASEWFEIIETDTAGLESRVGLYQDKDEAELGLKTRRDIAEAKTTNLKFDIQRVDWKDLQQ